MERFLKRLVIFIVVMLFGIVAYYFYDNFRVKTETELLAQIIHDEDRRELTERLKDFTSSENAKIRSRAALAVGRIGAKGSAPLLFEMIGDASMDVASTAAFALGLTGEKGYAARLMDVINDVPAGVARYIVGAAGRLADSAMVEFSSQLVELLSHPSPDVREAVCMALYRSGSKSKAPALINFMSREKDELVLKAALYTLARFGVEEAETIFMEYFADSDPAVRALAVRGLGKSNSSEGDHYLAIALNDSDPGVVAQAVIELGARGNINARKQTVRKFERTDDATLVTALLRAMRRQENNLGAEAVIERLAQFNSAEALGEAVLYLAEINKDRAVNLIDSLAATGEAYIRARCAEAYGLTGNKNVIPRAALLFSDEDGMVRRAALEMLLVNDIPNQDFYLNKALVDQDYVVVSTAIEHIGENKIAEYLPVLTTMMSGGRDVDIDIRRSILDAARNFLEDDQPDKRAIDILVEGALDPEFVVRRASAEIYRDIFNQDHRRAVSVASTRISIGEIEDALEKYKINPYATIVTEYGEIDIELFFDTAPLTVLNFIGLANENFYDGLNFHRVVPNFVIQGGDPRGDGWGGPDYMIRCEYSNERYLRGTVGIATSGKDTGGSQFFITLSPQPRLEGSYTVFGQVISGMEHVDQISYGTLIQKIIIQEE